MLERVYEKLELKDLIVNGEAEQWVQVCEIEGLEMFREWYWISNFGRVKSTRGNGKILRQSDNGNGYLIVGLVILDGKSKKMYVHRLIGFAFVSDWSEGLVVNHLDEDKKNNHFDNLEWCTIAENNAYGTRNQRSAEKRSMPVIGTCVTTGGVIEFPSLAEAQKNGFDKSHISACCRGKNKTHKGYRWKYEEEEENLND